MNRIKRHRVSGYPNPAASPVLATILMKHVDHLFWFRRITHNRRLARTCRQARSPLECGRSGRALCGAGLPSAPPWRRHHAQQSRLSRHESVPVIWIAGIAFQLSWYRIKRRSARWRTRRGGDVQAALDWLEREFHLPILFTGFSFGAAIGLRACCGDERVKGLIALGLPVHAEGRDYHYHFLASAHSRSSSSAALWTSTARNRRSKRSSIQRSNRPNWSGFDGADHFFAGKLDQVQAAIRNWVQTHFLPARVS